MRPTKLSEFVGQAQVVQPLEMMVTAALNTERRMGHTLILGPKGLGKTTLCRLIPDELGVELEEMHGRMISSPAEVLAVLMSLAEGSVLFIEEAHALNAPCQECLYTVMEDFRISHRIGSGSSAKLRELSVPPFTVVAATTRSGQLLPPFRDRFKAILTLEYYSPEELERIILNAAQAAEVTVTPAAAARLASRSRGTPRIALTLLEQARNYSDATAASEIGEAEALGAMQVLGVRRLGLRASDIKVLRALAAADRPMGINALAARLEDEEDVISETIEPFLLRQGLMSRTPSGRVITSAGRKYLEE